MRQERLKQLKTTSTVLSFSLEEVEKEIAKLGDDSEHEKEIRYLARLIYAGQIVEKVGLLYSFNEQALYQFLMANKSALEKPPE